LRAKHNWKILRRIAIDCSDKMRAEG
jgi:hypothetical protein